MRLTLAMAVACLGIVGIATADPARASIKQRTEIPAQGLGPALTTLAKEFDFQVLYRTEVVGTLKTQGASGAMTAAEALEHVLSGTGLTYKYLDDRTVTIMPVSSAPPASISEDAKKENQSQGGDQKKSFWDRFRLAQATSSAQSQSPVPSAIFAQSGNPTSSEGQQQQTTIDEIVVTAQKREERLQDVPISISVLSGEALDKSTVESLNDELTRVPGVVISPPTVVGATQIAVRGVAAAAPQWSGASPVAYYLDSVPFGFVRSAYIPDAGTFDIARVEVLRGPQGTLYGANAADGVVRVLTSDADPTGFDMKARVVGSGTEHGGANGGGDLAINVPLIDGKLALRGVVDYHDWSGYIDRPGDNHANDGQLRDYRLKIAYRPTDALSIDLSSWINRDHYGALSAGLPNDTAPDSGITAEPVDNRFDSYGAKISYQLAHVSITSMTSYLYYNSYNEQDLTPYGGFFTGWNVHNRIWSNVISEEFLVNSTDTGPWRWTAGAFYRDAEDVNWQNVVPVNVGYVNFKDTSKSYAVFGQLGRRFLDDKFEWTLGARQFHDDVASLSLDQTQPSFKAGSYSATTPRVGLSWYPNPDITVYSAFSEGYRSGMPQYYTVNVVNPNVPDLKPDKLYNYEVGIKADFLDHRLAIDMASYFVKWKDVQQAIPLALPNGTVLIAQVNGESASGPGLDVAITARPLARLQVGGSVSWNDLTWDGDVTSAGGLLFHKGDRLNNSSKYTGSLFANYTFPLGGDRSGDLSLNASYMSAWDARGLNSLNETFFNPGDDVLSLQAAFTVHFTTNLSTKLFGENLTNQSRTVNQTHTLDPSYAPSQVEFSGRPRPRTIGLELDYRYR